MQSEIEEKDEIEKNVIDILQERFEIAEYLLILLKVTKYSTKFALQSADENIRAILQAAGSKVLFSEYYKTKFPNFADLCDKSFIDPSDRDFLIPDGDWKSLIKAIEILKTSKFTNKTAIVKRKKRQRTESETVSYFTTENKRKLSSLIQKKWPKFFKSPDDIHLEESDENKTTWRIQCPVPDCHSKVTIHIIESTSGESGCENEKINFNQGNFKKHLEKHEIEDSSIAQRNETDSQTNIPTSSLSYESPVSSKKTTPKGSTLPNINLIGANGKQFKVLGIYNSNIIKKCQ